MTKPYFDLMGKSMVLRQWQMQHGLLVESDQEEFDN